jgi:hypothetical protein
MRITARGVHVRALTLNSGRKTMPRYVKKSSQKIEEKMQEMKRGLLKGGRAAKKVLNPRQAIAIALSEARKEGGGMFSVGSRSRSTTKRAAAAKRKSKVKTRVASSTRRSYSKKRSSRSRKAQ